MKKILLPCLLSFGIASAQNTPPPDQPFPGGQLAPAQPFSDGQPSEGPSDHISVHGIVKSASPQKISVENESGTVEFAVDDYSEVILPPMNFAELDQEDHKELNGARVHIGLGTRPDGRKAIDHIHVDQGNDHEGHPPHAAAPGVPHHQPGPGGVPHTAAPGVPHHQPGPGGVPHSAAPGVPHQQPGPGGVPHTAAPGVPHHQPGHEGGPEAGLFGVIEQVAAGKIIVKTMQGSISELNIDDKSEIVFPPEKYLDLDAGDFQRMIGQKVHLAVGSRPNGQKAIDHIDVLLGEHDEPQHEGGHPPVPNGNAPFPQR